jgi:hypothetical protein
MRRIEFNCVEMKHKGAEYVLAQTSGLSKEQELKFWQEQSKHLREHQKSLRQQRATA